MLYSIRTPEKLQLRSFVKKYVKNVPISTNALQGTFSITNIRFYTCIVEIEVAFTGTMYGRMGRNPNVWLTSEILKRERVSKIRVNRFIKKSLVKKIDSRLALFGLELRHHSYIKKLKWI